MPATDSSLLRNYIAKLKEKDVWSLLTEFFLDQDIQATVVHSTSEHGMDVVALISESQDILGFGFNVLIQAKTGNLTLDKWRKEILFQLLESRYYDIPDPKFPTQLSRRILLVVTGKASPEVKDSIIKFNMKHEVPIELWEMDDLLRRFYKSGFASRKLEQITGVGQRTEDLKNPPVVGEPTTN